MKIEEKNVCKFRYIMNTFSIDENFKRWGGWFLVTNLRRKEKKIQIRIDGN
jgi:hypothetical protein